MRWIKHLTCSARDPQLVQLIAKHGAAGYGMYWMLLEVVAEQVDERGLTELSYPAKHWAKILGTYHGKGASIFLQSLADLSLISLDIDGNLFRVNIPNILKYRDEWSKKKARNSGVTPEPLRSKDLDIEEEKYNCLSLTSSEEKGNCLSLTSSSQSKSLAISEGGTGGEDAPSQPDGCPIDTPPSPAPKKRKTPAEHRPKACPADRWEKYLAYSRKFLADQHEQLGDMAKPDETKAVSGAKALDTLIRVRGHPPAQVYKALEWAKSDPFWVLQVRSLGGLLAKGKNGETKFDNICAAMVREAMQDERKT